MTSTPPIDELYKQSLSQIALWNHAMRDEREQWKDRFNRLLQNEIRVREQVNIARQSLNEAFQAAIQSAASNTNTGALTAYQLDTLFRDAITTVNTRVDVHQVLVDDLVDAVRTLRNILGPMEVSLDESIKRADEALDAKL